jgi:hypothetical protein
MTALICGAAYVKLSTRAVDKSVDRLRVQLPSAGFAKEFFDLGGNSPLVN